MSDYPSFITTERERRIWDLSGGNYAKAQRMMSAVKSGDKSLGDFTAGVVVPDPTKSGSTLSGVPTTDPHDGRQGSDSEGDGTPDPYSGERVENDTGVSFADKAPPALTIEQAEQALSGTVSVPSDALEGETVTISGTVRNTGDRPLNGTIKLTWKKDNRGVDLAEKTVTIDPGESVPIEAIVESVPYLKYGRKVWLMAEAGQPTSTVEIDQAVLETRDRLEDHPLANQSGDDSGGSGGSGGSDRNLPDSDDSTDSTDSESSGSGGNTMEYPDKVDTELERKAWRMADGNEGEAQTILSRLKSQRDSSNDSERNLPDSEKTAEKGDSDEKRGQTADDDPGSTVSGQLPGTLGGLKQYAPLAIGAAAVAYGVSQR